MPESQKHLVASGPQLESHMGFPADLVAGGPWIWKHTPTQAAVWPAFRYGARYRASHGVKADTASNLAFEAPFAEPRCQKLPSRQKAPDMRHGAGEEPLEQNGLIIDQPTILACCDISHGIGPVNEFRRSFWIQCPRPSHDECTHRCQIWSRGRRGAFLEFLLRSLAVTNNPSAGV